MTLFVLLFDLGLGSLAVVLSTDKEVSAVIVLWPSACIDMQLGRDLTSDNFVNAIL